MDIRTLVKPAIAIGGGLVVGAGAGLVAESVITPRSEKRALDHDVWEANVSTFKSRYPEPGGDTLRYRERRGHDGAVMLGIGSAVVGAAGGAAIAFAPNPGIRLAGMAAAAIGAGGLAGSIIGYNAIK